MLALHGPSRSAEISVLRYTRGMHARWNQEEASSDVVCRSPAEEVTVLFPFSVACHVCAGCENGTYEEVKRYVVKSPTVRVDTAQPFQPF